MFYLTSLLLRATCVDVGVGVGVGVPSTVLKENPGCGGRQGAFDDVLSRKLKHCASCSAEEKLSA